MPHIGDICICVFQYYNAAEGKNSFKKRPVIVIGKADNRDYVVLPVSRVTARAFLDEKYDYQVNPNKLKELQLSAMSYIRTHKQTVEREEKLTRVISNLKDSYPDIFNEVIDLVEDFQKIMIRRAR